MKKRQYPFTIKNMKSYNEAFENHFNEIADLMSILGENNFKIRAYRDVARKMKEEIDPIYKDITKKELKKTPGVGDALADKMIEFIETGKMNYLEKLRNQIPQAVRDLLKIPHLGPNRVRDLYLKLAIKSKEDLLKKAKEGQIAELDGFGDKLVQQILTAIETGQEKKKRHNRNEVIPVVEKIMEILKEFKTVTHAEVAGSYRRQAETIGDIDILVGGTIDKIQFKSSIQKTFAEITFLADGETKMAFVVFPENLQVDIRFVADESYGSALLYFTGSKDFNVKMRKIAIEKGCLLNEYGLHKDGEKIAGKTEEEVFKALDMEFTEPNYR